MNGQRVGSSLTLQCQSFWGKSSYCLADMKKNLKTFPAFMSFLATASTSNLKEDGYVLEFSLENGDTFWCLERDF